MMIQQKDLNKSKNYSLLRRDEINIYTICNNVNTCTNISRTKIKNCNITIDKTNNLSHIKNKSNFETKKYDIIIFDSSNNYKVSTSEQLRTLAKRFSVENNKARTAVYLYQLENNISEIKLIYETPYYSSSEIIQIDNNKYDIQTLYDYIVYKHDERNSSIRPKIYTLK